MNERKELIVTIPAKSVENSVDYLSSNSSVLMEYLSDPFNNENVHNKILGFIRDVLQQYNIKMHRSVSTYFSEIINNAYDSFYKNNINITNDLIIKVVAKVDKNDANKLMIKIMDNGSGFVNQPKSLRFTVVNIDEPKKDMQKFIGGVGMGLKNFENALSTNMNGNLYFKNRKEGGASIYLELKKMSSKQQAEPNQDTQVPKKQKKRNCDIM